MTNNWTDLGNSTCVIVMGANPAENHPASIAHINAARTAGPKTLPGGQTSNKPAARMIVIDPRKTRTALLADQFIRIRPGTDIPFINAVINYIINNISGARKTNWETWLNSTATPGLEADLGGASTVTGSKYTDARFVVNTAQNDYKRTVKNGSAGLISNVPEFAASYNEVGVDTVFNKLAAHLAPYTTAVSADICGCTEQEIIDVADAIMENSRCASYAPGSESTIIGDPTHANYRATTFLYAMGLTQHTNGAQNVKSFATLQLLMGNTGRAGGGINALRGIHNVQGSTDMGLLYHLIPGYSANPSGSFGDYMNALYGVRTSGAKYANVIQGSAAVNSDLYFSSKAIGVAGNAITVDLVDPSGISQPLSVGVVGSAITVNLATDAGTALISTAAEVKAAIEAFGAANALINVGVEGDGSGVVDAAAAALAGGVDATHAAAYTGTGLQQAGFRNMTKRFFGGDNSVSWTNADVDALYSCWPKTNGRDHIGLFRDMAQGIVKGAVVWGQNPAVTEPNQSAVREGLEALDVLVCVDMFENETAAAARKADSFTYLFPASSHVEEAGSSTNSGRVLQWRYEAIKPQGDSKTDLELLMRFAKACDLAGAFSHITTALAATSSPVATNVWDKLYGTPYGWTWGTPFSTGPSITGDYVSQPGNVESTSATLTGSEAVAERIYREMCSNVTIDGALWIYTNAYAAPGNSTTQYPSSYTAEVWTVSNRAKSRKTGDAFGTLSYPRWGYAWLINRRVLYNNGDIHRAGTTTASDQIDGYQGPDGCGRLFVSTKTGTIDYGRTYRHIHRLADMPKNAAGITPTNHKTPGRFPSHTEPYETPREDLIVTWGKNTRGGVYHDLLPSVSTSYFTDTPLGTVADYPLVLTTIRCVEHFQGGPITRNNAFNVELEPVPWIELNSIDARANGIVDGDLVKIVTARTEGATAGGAHLLANPGAGWRARVGVGQMTNQRVGQGVVGIPWHWGDKGLSTGSRANDLCIDANDANTTIPEYKACLCRIEKM